LYGGAFSGRVSYFHGPSDTVIHTISAHEQGAQCWSLQDTTYVKLAYGTAACPAGTDVTTSEECKQAVSALGIPALRSPWIGTHSDIPKYCSVLERGSDPRLHFGLLVELALQASRQFAKRPSPMDMSILGRVIAIVDIMPGTMPEKTQPT
jgi:hypothetical protein